MAEPDTMQKTMPKPRVILAMIYIAALGTAQHWHTIVGQVQLTILGKCLKYRPNTLETAANKD